MAASPVMIEKSHSRAVTAPWPAEGPITPQTHGHEPRQRRLGLKVVGASPAGVAGRMGGAMAGAFQQHDQRDALATGDVGDAPPFASGGRADGAAHGGEVLGTDRHRAAFDRAHSGHQGVCWNRAGQGADLSKGARVEQRIYTASGIEAAGGSAGGHLVGPAHGPSPRLTALEVRQRGVPASVAAHAGSGPSTITFPGVRHVAHGSHGPNRTGSHQRPNRTPTLPNSGPHDIPSTELAAKCTHSVQNAANSPGTSW